MARPAVGDVSQISADGAQAGRDVTLIQNVGGPVTIYQQSPEKPVSPQADPDRIASAREQYASRLKQRYGRLDLEVLTPLQDQDEHPTIELREVFIPQSVRADPPPIELPRELLQRLSAGSEIHSLALPPGVDREALERIRQAYLKAPQLPIMKVLTSDAAQRMVLLGDPGAGKSTLARYIALALTTSDTLLPDLNSYLPLIIELRSYAEADWRKETFESFLAHLQETEGLSLPSDLLGSYLTGSQAEKLWLFFDGLDEIFEPEVRGGVTQRIAAFAEKYPHIRITVTSRRIGYQRATLDAAGFSHYMLQDLSNDQIRKFAHKWFTNSCPSDLQQARKLAQRVTSAITDSPSVRELAGNPLTLTILAIIGRRRELPRDRRTVYEHAVAVLVEHWDPSKYLKDRRVEEHLPYLGSEDKHELLRLVARRMQEGHGGIAGNHIAGPDLIETFQMYLQGRYDLPADRATAAARIMLQQFRERNFILSRFGGEVYGFVHRTFLEYLAAADIAYRFNVQRALSEEDLLEGIFARRWQDSSWREVLLLLVGLVDERFSAAALDAILDKVPVAVTYKISETWDPLTLCIHFLGEIRRLGQVAQQSRAVIRRVVSAFEMHAALNLPYIYPDEGISKILPVLTSLGPNWAGRNPFIDWHSSRHAVLRFEDDEYAVSNSLDRIAARMLVSLMQPEESTALRTLAVESESPTVRSVAVERLGEGYPVDVTVVEMLRKIASEDESHLVRASALESLPGEGASGLDTAAFLCERAIADNSADVRAEALRVLAKIRPASEQTASFLKSRAKSDEDVEVRVRALVLLGRVDSQALATLLEHLQSDAESEVRGAALRGIVNLSPIDSSLYSQLRSYFLEDSDEIVRAVAFRAICDNWIKDSDVLTLIREHALQDECAEIRAVALGYYANLWPSEFDYSIAWRMVELDESDEVRDMAMRILASEVPDNSKALSFVRLLAVSDKDSNVRLACWEVLAESRTDEEMLRLLVDGATNESDEYVRAYLMYLLAVNWRSDATAYAALTQAMDDPAAEVRIAAIDGIAHFSEMPEARSFVESQVCAKEKDENVRVAALKGLVRRWMREEQVQILLRSLVGDEGNSAVGELARVLLMNLENDG
ncbi:HEAT repeat domain-containing protein [Streptomyces sp. 11x1]|uniref:HEAT repeat domain-containing protein n=1 Tax=Streptomyces sp. 11x1 TaxID=3038642 RepID=UPI002930D427|nr:HEAT repeat domain-containing protein [Streptomyces sp. 11x1]WNZ12170.1 HEAT repeat domain-containing protein [Streptomyces sp. 11x1]